MAKIIKYEKRVDVDRGKGAILFQRGIKPVKKGEPIYTVPSKSLVPRDEERLVGVDAAYYYMECKREEHAEDEEDVRRAIFVTALYMGMCVMATLYWALGFLK